MVLLIGNPPLQDGNKRTGTAAAGPFPVFNSRPLTANNKLDAFSLRMVYGKIRVMRHG